MPVCLLSQQSNASVLLWSRMDIMIMVTNDYNIHNIMFDTDTTPERFFL